MPDLMSRVLASSSSYGPESPPSDHDASSYLPSRPPKRPNSPSAPLGRSRRSRKLSEGGLLAAQQVDMDFVESDDDSDGDSSEGRATPSPRSRSSSLNSIKGVKVESELSRELSAASFYTGGGTSTPSRQVPLASPFASLAGPSTSENWAWDPVGKRLVTVSPSSPTLEILSFPTFSYLGNLTPADSRTNDFIRAQQCVSSCGKRFKKDERPWRMRKHYVECEKRRAVFEEKGEKDPLARLCELQLQAQGTSLTRVRNRHPHQPIEEAVSVSVDGPRSLRSASRPRVSMAEDEGSDADNEEEAGGEALDQLSTPVKSRARIGRPPKIRCASPTLPAPPKSRAAPPRTIEASTGRFVTKRPQQAEPRSCLRIIIHFLVDCTPIIQLHLPPVDHSAPLPSPRLLRPCSILHASSSSGSTISSYTYALPSFQLSQGAGVSIELGDGEVHVDEEVRSWLAVEGSQVVLRVRGEDAEWVRVK